MLLTWTAEYAHTTRVNEKIDVYSFGVILLELTTGRKANDGDEHTSLAQWAWRHIQESNPIVDALDEAVKEPDYLDEMSCVFNLGIICTNTQPLKRPSMKEVLQILLKCSQPLIYGGKNTASFYDASPLLKNSKRDNVSENDDEILESVVWYLLLSANGKCSSGLTIETSFKHTKYNNKIKEVPLLYRPVN